eukprot:600850_1
MQIKIKIILPSFVNFVCRLIGATSLKLHSFTSSFIMGNLWYQSETENDVSYLETYEKLLRMGFDEAIALKASQIHQKDINKAIEYIQQNTTPTPNPMKALLKAQQRQKVQEKVAHAQQQMKQQKSKPKIAAAKSTKNKPKAYDQCDECHGDVSSCGITQQLMRIISRYGEYVNTNSKDDFNQYLNELHDDIMNILNMFHHVLSKHGNSNDFAFIYDNLFDDGGQCILNKCRINGRNRNIKRRNSNDIDFDGVDNELVPIQQVLDSIHCHFVHSYDSGYRLRQNDDGKKQQRLRPKVSDDDSKQPHNKFTTNLGKSIHNTLDNDDQLPSYSYGFQLYYWDHYKTINQRDKLGRKFYVPNKYKNLKEELLTNEVYTIDVNQLNEELDKSKLYINSEKCKSLKPHIDGYNYNQKIFDEHPIHYGYTDSSFDHPSLNHLLCIQIYCKYDILQREATATLRKERSNETIAHLIKRNSNFHFFIKHLTEAVNLFGIQQYEGDIDYFYHGVSCNMLFESMSPRIYGLLSTTRVQAVAARFSAVNGLILQLRADPILKYFPCEWISQYPQEAELLFVGGFEPFTVKTIVSPSTGVDYRDYIRSMAVLDAMTNSRAFSDDQQIFAKIFKITGASLNMNPLNVGAMALDDACKTSIEQLIENEFNNNGNVDRFVSNLFHHICSNKRRVFVNWDLMNAEVLPKYDRGGYLGYSFLKPMFCGKGVTNRNPRLNFHFLNKLYPNLTWIGYFDLPCLTLHLLNDIFNFSFKNYSTKVKEIVLFFTAKSLHQLSAMEASTAGVVDKWMAKQTFPIHLQFRMEKIMKHNCNVVKLSLGILPQ